VLAGDLTTGVFAEVLSRCGICSWDFLEILENQHIVWGSGFNASGDVCKKFFSFFLMFIALN
jgi:hypothetical protein